MTLEQIRVETARVFFNDVHLVTSPPAFCLAEQAVFLIKMTCKTQLKAEGFNIDNIATRNLHPIFLIHEL